MKRLNIILRFKYIFKILVLIFIFGDILFINLFDFKSKYDNKDTVFTGIVTKYELNNKKLLLEIKAKEKLIINYKYGNKIFNNLSYGDKVLVKGTLKEPIVTNIPNTFNYKKYLYSKKIYYIVEATSIDKIGNNNNYYYTIKNILYKKIDKLKSSNYIKTLLLGDNTIFSEINDSYRINGISHLFSISGMHIGLITNIVYYYLNKITRNKKIKYIIIDVFLILYYFLVNTSSLLRSTIMNILFSINFIFKLNIKKIDIMFITLIMSIIINPFIIYDIGFVYSYIISFFLILYSDKIKNKNKIYKTISVTLVSFFVSFPITIYNSYEINIISIFMNVILVPIISIVVFPLTILTLVFPTLDNILYYITILLEKFSLFMSNIDFTKLIFSKPNIIFILIYYLLILIILNNKNYFYLLIILIFINYIKPYINYNFEIMMFDVGEADSILMKYPHNERNILIDTGMNDYTMTYGIIPYLKSIGMRKIHYLVISHGDYDHMGEAINLVENFKVEQVIFNCGTFNELEQELIKVLNNKKIPYYSCIKELNIDDNKLYFLNDKDYGNENDNSSIIYTEINNHKFLFMGDAGVEVEEDLIEKYNLQNIDVLKVGHHGSKTSTGKNFIDEIEPKYSIISVGKNNRYGHPNANVLNNLEGSKIYRTDQDGSIMFKISKNKLMIETCAP